MNRTKYGRGGTVFPTAIGWVGIRWAGEFVQRVTLAHANEAQALVALELHEISGENCSASAAPAGLVSRLRNFARGNSDDFLDVSLDLTWATAFQKKIIEFCRQIPYGTTCSYSLLAQQAGHPGAARAVGTVMAKNRFPLIVPCHRVVGSGANRLGGFSAPGGLTTKQILLELEQTAPVL